jgi:hypothetical protein
VKDLATSSSPLSTFSRPFATCLASRSPTASRVAVCGRSCPGNRSPGEEFRSVYAELGVGGIHHAANERPPLHFPYESRSFDELNSVTQSGNTKMVRMGEWKLTLDSEGNGDLYNLAADPAELVNLYAMPEHAATQLALTTELLQWTIRTEDDLPGGRYTRCRQQSVGA